jgi:acyl-CoA thioester hydrolase
MTRPEPSTRARYRHFLDVPTRWMDNDIYGHVNNVVYYSFFDTAVNTFLIGRGVLDIHAGGIIGLVVETGCRYFKALSFPEPVQAGLAVTPAGQFQRTLRHRPVPGKRGQGRGPGPFRARLRGSS